LNLCAALGLAGGTSDEYVALTSLKTLRQLAGAPAMSAELAKEAHQAEVNQKGSVTESFMVALSKVLPAADNGAVRACWTAVREQVPEYSLNVPCIFPECSLNVP
jgi:hypothetical protein